MSYQTWHEYGFGFIFSGFEAECEKIGDPITVEDVEHLLACNLPLHRDVHEWLDEIREDNPPAHLHAVGNQLFLPCRDDGFAYQCSS